MNINLRRRLTAASAAAALLFAAAFAPAAARARTAPAPADLNLRDFGAFGDGVTDDGPALQRALDALAAAGGGTLNVPAGRYVIGSPVVKNFNGLAAPVTIRGVGSATTVDHTRPGNELTLGLNLVSEFYPRTREQAAALAVTGLRSLVVSDLAFVGTPNVATDAAVVLAFDRVESAVVRHCEFYGLSTLVAGGAIIRSMRGGLRIEQSKFLGTVGNSGVYVPVVENLEWKSVSLADVIFADYGQRPELFGKTNIGAPYSWVNIGNAAPPTGDSPRREVSVRRVFLDEGGYVGLSSIPYRYSPATAPIDLYYISDLHMNVSNLGTTGHYLDGLRNVLIEDSRYVWSKKTDSAVYVLSVGNAILDRIHTEAAATRLRAGTGTKTLTVIDSTYQDLASQAQTTRVIQTDADEDDPVWYVRQRFAAALGRDPDPAAHLYWSDQILGCGEADAACVAARRAALNAYLASAPPATFNLTGRVTDSAGAAVGGAAVSLTGSLTVRAYTDAAGNYRFRDLPTSGVYTVGAGHAHFTSATPPQTFTTPNGNRAADFSGTPRRFNVSGRVLDNAGKPLAGMSVFLTGSQTAVAVTDAAGNYAFPNLTGGGNVTFTPSLLGYKFAPAASNAPALGANQTVNFTGTPTTHTVAGRVTTNGAGRPGVTVTLSGSRGATTTTDADGNYSFAGLPAGGNYTVTPSAASTVIAPTYKSYDNLGANQTADFKATPFVNHARASNGAQAAASSYIDIGRAPLAAINGDRRGLHWGNGAPTGSGWTDSNANAFPDWIEVAFPGPRTVQEVSVFTIQDNYTAPAEPTATMTFTKYGATAYQVQYWTGSAWALVPGGTITANNRVWRKLTFAPLSTTKLRVLVNAGQGGVSRLTEIEAWGPAPPAPATPPRVNHAAAANGADVAVSSYLDAGRHPFAAINGDRKGLHWGSDPATGSGWTDISGNSFPDYLEITFNATKTITEVSVYGLQDNFSAPAEPTAAMVANTYALVDFRAQYWNGSAWVDLPNGVVAGNNKVWRRITFPAVTTRKVRVYVTKALAGFSRVTEVEVY